MYAELHLDMEFLMENDPKMSSNLTFTENLDTLEEWVREIFSQVPNK